MYTREIGNKVYLTYTLGSDQPFQGTDEDFIRERGGSGFSVEVFDKNPEQSLQDVIRQQFLTGYPANDCYVLPQQYGPSSVHRNYQTAVIAHSRPTSPRTVFDAAAKCPKYVSGNGLRYFMMDVKHPGKLLFVSIGHDNIPSGIGGTWDMTIRVLDDDSN
jgi:hypothetical protein